MDLPLTTAATSDLIVLDSVDSTNSYIAEDAGRFQDFSVVASVNQTEGRGRRGRQWLSVPGRSLAVSVVVPFDCSSVAITWLPVLAGVAVVRSLQEISEQQVDVKWPNDLLSDGKKVGGILCQMLSSKRSIVGVGTNFAVREADLPANGGSIWHPGFEFEHAVDTYLSSFVGNLRAALIGIAGLPDGEAIARQLGPAVNTIGKTVRVHETKSLSWSGQAVGLSPRGHLIVRLPDGREREVVAADIEHLRE